MTNNFEKLVKTVSKLRSPNGCPWDREQNHQSLKANLLEETYEAIEAIERGNPESLKEELGDVLLQVVLHSQIASESGDFDLEDVAGIINEKLIRRHPHVFGDVTVRDSAEVVFNWEEIKRREKPERKSALSGIARTLPALMAAQELSKKAVKTGFEWPDTDSLWQCLQSEIEEFKNAVTEGNRPHIEDELGDIFFTLVNVARWYGIDAETALLRANTKFKNRFQAMENLSGKDLKACTIDELEDLWQQAKRQ